MKSISLIIGLFFCCAIANGQTTVGLGIYSTRTETGLGIRGDWNLVTSHKFGGIIPIGVEAFSFPF